MHCPQNQESFFFFLIFEETRPPSKLEGVAKRNGYPKRFRHRDGTLKQEVKRESAVLDKDRTRENKTARRPKKIKRCFRVHRVRRRIPKKWNRGGEAINMISRGKIQSFISEHNGDGKLLKGSIAFWES